MSTQPHAPGSQDGQGEDGSGEGRLVPQVPLDLAIRIVEAMLFASSEPLSEQTLSAHVGDSLGGALEALAQRYATSGVVLMEVAGGYALRTAEDLAYLFEEAAAEPRKLSRAALETLAIIAYHQPVTRAEIEDIRGVSASKGTLDVLLETGWVRMRGRRRTPGRPVTYGTTPGFLDNFSLASIADLPGLDELKGAGLLEAIPQGTLGPITRGDGDQLAGDEDPLEAGDDAAERSAMALWPQDDGEARAEDRDEALKPDG